MQKVTLETWQKHRMQIGSGMITLDSDDATEWEFYKNGDTIARIRVDWDSPCVETFWLTEEVLSNVPTS